MIAMRWRVLAATLFVACGSPTRAPLADAPSATDAQPIDSTTDGSTLQGDPFAAFQALPAVCSSDGWCWQWPTPSGSSYSHIRSTAPDNIWITGVGVPSFSPIMQWNGQQWITHTPPEPPGYPTYAAPTAISTTGPNNTWIAYDDIVEHWDGTSWRIINSPPTYELYGMWADPDGNAWVTDGAGTLRLWSPSGVELRTFPNIGGGAIWGTADDDLFLTGIGAVVHYDGTSFTKIYQGSKTAGAFQGVKDDVWISGETILHWDGSIITEVPPTLPMQQPAIIRTAEYAAADNVTWLVNGTSAAPATIIHWDGAQLTNVPIDPSDASLLTATGDNKCGALGESQIIAGKWWMVCSQGGIVTIEHGTALTSVIAPLSGLDLWGTSPTDLYLATGDELHHWDGATWTGVGIPDRVLGLSGLPDGELFGTHERFLPGAEEYVGFLDHFDGTTWTSIAATQYPLFGDKGISAVYPIGPGEAILIGGQGLAFHYASGALTPIESGTKSDLIGVWGPDNDHLSITGNGGTLLQWDRMMPDVFTPDPSGPVTTDNLRDITAAGGITWIIPANQVYVWMKPSGGAWQQVSSLVPPTSIAAISATNVVVNGTDAGAVSRWNGTAFVREQYPSGGGLQKTFALPDGTTYVYGLDGIVVHAP